MAITERIMLIRQQKKMSQSELSEKAGINLKSLSIYELDSSIPSANALKKLAGALGVSADVLSDDQVSIKDKELLKKFETIQNIGRNTKSMIIEFLNLLIWNLKTKKSYTS